MLDSILIIRYDGLMKCCDGTGWTGVEGAPCAVHYEPCGDLFEFYHDEVEVE